MSGPEDREWDELDDRVVELLRQGPLDEPFEEPPSRVWDAIAGEVGLADPAPGRRNGSHPPPASGSSSYAEGVVPLRPERRPPGDSGPADRPDPPTHSRQGPSRPGPGPGLPRRWRVAAVAAALAVLAVPAWLLARPDAAPDAQLVAATQLDPLVGDGRGSAELHELDGQHQLVLDVADLEPVPGGYYEVWLLTPDIDDMVSLGPLAVDGRYPVPDGIDPARFSVIDISAEPDDGDDTHSGDSRLRGQLTL
jgi:hypothetical protein